MFKKILIGSFIFTSLLFSANISSFEGNKDYFKVKTKIWDLNSIKTSDLVSKRDKSILHQWFLDPRMDFAIVTSIMDRNIFRTFALPYNSYYSRDNKNEWIQFLRADRLSDQIKIKRLIFPNPEKYDIDLTMYWINKDVVLTIVDFEKQGFEKMKYLYNVVMPYYKKKIKVDKTKFIIVGNIVIDKKKDYEKLKKYFNFYISEGNKLKKEGKKYKLVGLKDVVTVKKSKRVVKAYVDYSLMATSKYGKKNINKYVEKLSDEYPVNFYFWLKKIK